MEKVILHVDMDAFYASVEQRDNPSLKGKPIAVGGRSARGVVTTASYEARKYGVSSAMPMEKARQRCSDLIVVPGNMKKYKMISKEIYKILSRYSKKIEKISIDEAFLEIESDNYMEVVENIRSTLKKELGLTASIGVSYNKFLAKLGSDMDKPNGVTFIKKEEAVSILKPLSISKIFGIGPMMVLELNKLGIFYIEDIQTYDKDILLGKFGKKGGEIYNFSFGIDKRELDCNEPIQSISEEETFEKDIHNVKILYDKLYEQSLHLERELDKKRLFYNTITIKIKYGDFTTETRSLTSSLPYENKYKIYELSKYILDNRFDISKSVRLIGITLSNLIYPDDPFQMSIEIGE